MLNFSAWLAIIASTAYHNEMIVPVKCNFKRAYTRPERLKPAKRL